MRDYRVRQANNSAIINLGKEKLYREVKKRDEGRIKRRKELNG